jgi:hypothetical protein
MGDETILNGFMDGFAKAAEDAGFVGEQVRELLKLSVDLAQGVVNPEAFGAGFAAVVGGR